MAKTISDEQIKFAIIINGDPAQKQLLDLEKATREVTKETAQLKIQRKQLSDQGKKDTAEWKALDNIIKANTTTIDNNRATMEELQKQIGITGLTMHQLREKARLLRMALENAVPGGEAQQRYQAELTQVNNRLGELSGRSRTAQSSIGSLADGFNRYQGMALAAVAALTGVVLSIQKITDINGKLSDAQSDVMKTTGMTKIEVDELTKSFGLLQTRTSRIDLLGIAEQGGRIGIAKAEIGDFVAVMNKASVSLGDSFTGGAEEVANKLGKIKFLFEQTKDMNVDQSYNAIGSAINDLGANGVASEANIAEFTTRIGSLTDVLKPTIQETLALGTAFEESGIEAEVSSRAYGIFMKQASTETAKFAQVMGISEQKVKDMINSNPLEFMLQFAQGMKGMNATDTAKTLDALGISADGANKVIGAMGNNTARFRELMELSNNSFASGTSLINEYELKNNNLAATLEKISKTVSGWFSSETFIKWLTVAVSWFAEFIGATEESTKRVSGFRMILAFTAKMIAVVIGSLISYSVATKIATADTRSFGVATAWANVQAKLQAMWTAIQIAGLTIYTGVMNLFGVTTQRATAKLVALNIAGAASPWGALFAVIGAVVAAYVAFSSSVNKATDSQISFSQQQKKLADEVGKSTAATKAHLSSLVNVINDTNVSLEVRKKAYDELVKIAPEFNGLIVKEGKKVEGLLTIYASYIKALDDVAFAKGMAKLNEKNIEGEINANQKLYNSTLKLTTAKKAYDDFINKNQDVRTRDRARWLALKENYEMSKEENELNKQTVENAKKRVTATNNFRLSEIKTLEKSIKADEIALKKLEKNSAAYTALSIKIKADQTSLDRKSGIVAGEEPTTSNYNPLDKDTKVGDTTNKKEEDKNKKFLEDAKKFEDDKLKIQRDAEDARQANLPEGYAKENEIEQMLFDRKITDLKSQLIKEEDIKAAFAQASNTKLSDAERDMWKSQAQLWEESNKANNSKIESATLAHKNKLGIITEKAGKDLIEKKHELYEKEKLNRETDFYNSVKYQEANEEEKKNLIEKFNEEELQLSKDYLNKKIEELNRIIGGEVIKGVDFSLLSPEAKDKLIKDTELVQNAVSKIKNPTPAGDGSKEIDLGLATGDKDILGFSQKQWEGFFTNLENGNIGIQTITMALGLATQAFSQLDQFMSASENASLKRSETGANKKKEHLKKQLDSGVISQKKYDKEVSKIDKELDEKKADIEYKQAKRQKAISIMNIAMSTAMAIMSIMSTGGGTRFADMGVTAGILTGIVTALGALQIATVLATPLPAKGHEEGLYQDYVTREQDGKKFKSSYGGKTRSGLVSKTSHFLVAENGPEMVIDNKAWRQMNPEVKDSLIRELRGIKGFEQGLYNQDKMRIEVPAASSPSSNNDTQMLTIMMSLVAENTAVLKDLRDKGVVGKFFRNDLKSMKEVELGIKDYNDLKTKNKI